MFAVTALYAGALGLLQFVLSMWVVWGRWTLRVSLGDGGIRNMERRIRVHGNFAEYVPMVLLLTAFNEGAGRPGWFLHVLGGGLLVGRLLHAYGLLRRGGPSPGRFVGMTLTYTVLVLAAAGALAHGAGSFGPGGP